jgi:hypothetical protein
MDNEGKKIILDEILSDITYYLYPELLIEEYQNLGLDSKTDKEKLEKYSVLLSDIRHAYDKVSRYDVYFEYFYTDSDKIQKFEQVKHHIHVYLQDVDTLKNKLQNLLGNLKNDINSVAENRQEISSSLKDAIDTVGEIFEPILKYRRQHVHKGSRFMEDDLLKAENNELLKEVLINPLFEKMINQDYKPKAIEKLKVIQEQSFNTAKGRWLNNAKKSKVTILKFLNKILEIIQPSLYQFLNIKSMKEILKK